MKKYIFLNLAIILSLSVFAQTFEWAKAEPYSSFVTWTSIVVHDNLGNSFISGQYYQSGISGIFIVKYDINGNKLWEKYYSGRHVSSMCTDTSGNLYTYMFAFNVNGVNYPINHGALFAKYDPNGNLLWIKLIPYILRLSERTDAQDNLVVTGAVIGDLEDTLHLENNVTLTSPLGGSRKFIARYNTNGECLWAIPDEGGNHPLICNLNGDMAVVSELYGDTVILGKGSNQIAFYPENGDGYIAKYKANGDLVWAKQFVTCGLALDDAGNTYSFEPDRSDINNGSFRNVYLKKFDANGNLLWLRTHLYLDDWYKFAMKSGANGDLYITGGFRNYMTIDDTTITGNGHYHVFVAKIDSSGTLKWITTTGCTSAGGAGAKDITIANGNEIYITGDMGGVNTFGATTINEPSGVFIAKIIDNDVSTTSIKYFPKSNTVFNVYPNPSNNIVNIGYSSNNTIKNLKLEIKNAIGQIIYSTAAMSINTEFKKSIDLSKQNKGIYFIEIIADKKREVRGIILN